MLSCGQPGGNISDDQGQVRVGPRRERVAHPHVKLVSGEPSLHERDLESLNHLLAVGTGRPQAAAVRRCFCHLVSLTRSAMSAASKWRAFGREKYPRVALSLGPVWRVYTDETEGRALGGAHGLGPRRGIEAPV